MTFGLRTWCLGLVLCVLMSGCGLSATSPTPTPLVAAAPPVVPTVPVVQTTRVPRGKLSLALVTDVGGLGDRSFNDLAWKALKAARRRYHARITVVQSTSEASYLPNLTSFAAKHPSLIVAVGASMASAMYKAAGRNPTQRFALVDARPVSSLTREVAVANVANVLFREQDAGYVAGALAGLIERRRVGHATHNTIGYLGAYPIPQITRYLAGYVSGARTSDPGVKVIGQFSGTYVDPKVGKTIAADQIRHGADVLFQVAAQTGAGYLNQANARGEFGIGSDINQSYIGPRVVTSAVKRVDVALFTIVQGVVRGRFRPGDNDFGASNNGTGISPPSALLPASIVKLDRTYARRVANGTVSPPVVLPAR